MDAIELLKADHKRVNSLFSFLDQAETPSLRRKIITLIRGELGMHSHLEETIFYPAIAELHQLSALISELDQEHQEVDEILDELATARGAELRDLADELISNVQEHVMKEEQVLFPEVRRLVSGSTLVHIAEMMEQERQRGMKLAA